MKILTIILTTILLSSCGKIVSHDSIECEGCTPTVRDTNNEDLEVSEIIEEFEQEFNVSVNFSVSIVADLKDYQNEGENLPSYVDGVCWSTNKKGIRIEIRKERWETLSAGSKHQLLTHELGHCALGADHQEGHTMDEEETTCPDSLMNPYTFTEKEIKECYIPKHNNYLDNLETLRIR